MKFLANRKDVDPKRIIGGGHSEGSVGFGFLLDHRLERPSKLSRVGWMLGWRLVARLVG